MFFFIFKMFSVKFFVLFGIKVVKMVSYCLFVWGLRYICSLFVVKELFLLFEFFDFLFIGGLGN